MSGSVDEREVEAVARALCGYPSYYGDMTYGDGERIARVAVAALDRVRGDMVRLHEVLAALRDESDWFADLKGSDEKKEGYALGFYEAADFIEERFRGSVDAR